MVQHVPVLAFQCNWNIIHPSYGILNQTSVWAGRPGQHIMFTKLKIWQTAAPSAPALIHLHLIFKLCKQMILIWNLSWWKNFFSNATNKLSLSLIRSTHLCYKTICFPLWRGDSTKHGSLRRNITVWRPFSMCDSAHCYTRCSWHDSSQMC